MIYILVALPSEFPNPDLDDSKYTVIFTGVGKVNASLHASLIANKPDCEMIINYGTAGVLRKELAGQLWRVNMVRQRDMDGRPVAGLGVTPFEETHLAGDINIYDGDGVVLSTGDNFVTKPPKLTSDLVDMEGYAITKVARYFSKEVILLKYGSDFADENAASNWQENCSKGQGLFLDWLASENLA